MPTTFPTSEPTLLCRVTVVPDEADVSREMASRLIGQVREKPHAVLGVATGSSPSGGYRVLREAATPGAFARVRVFALDEYVGLPAGHDRSYRRELETQVIAPLGIDPRRLHVPDPARRLVMVASGARKSDAVGRMLFGEVGPDSPASFLRRHRDLELIVDRALWEGM